MSSKDLKIWLHWTLNQTVVTFGHQTLTVNKEKQYIIVLIPERKILKKICGLYFDKNLTLWTKKQKYVYKGLGVLGSRKTH